jgi:hypothetical protein
MNTPQQLAAQIEANEVWALFTSDKKKKNQLLKSAKAMRTEIIRITNVDDEINKMSDDELLAALNA